MHPLVRCLIIDIDLAGRHGIGLTMLTTDHVDSTSNDRCMYSEPRNRHGRLHYPGPLSGGRSLSDGDNPYCYAGAQESQNFLADHLHFLPEIARIISAVKRNTRKVRLERNHS